LLIKESTFFIVGIFSSRLHVVLCCKPQITHPIEKELEELCELLLYSIVSKTLIFIYVKKSMKL